ncbi:PH, RCC1 and FYVE domains-containing protein 1 [Vitis vinifera]|uniref:PH, RCC1 and FYVE domains-containing protein 1 n=1 Tax=Vitis vinifera TaxID=29760 RepID=A0A438DQ56_VITVI|nr:PH, RCC1 and FYVE domains-containing protein 1 [Vitis vinifera]
MDRSWMSKDRRSKDYADGVESLIAFALQYSTYKNSIKCPCLQCDAAPNGPPTSRAEWHHTVEFNDVDSTIEMVQVAYDDRKNDPKLFETLLEDAQKPLYPGCRNFTKLSALVKLYNLKARYGWSDKSFSELLSILGDMLPLNNELHLSMYEAKKTLNTLGMEYEKIHACPNDCILYRNELKDATSCPTCGTSRWKLDGTGTKKRKGVLAKVMWYFPPIPRFRRLFQSLKIAKDLIWPAQEREFDGKMHHPSDSPSWKLVDHRWPDFASEPKNLRLAISTDGVECYDVHQQEVFTLKAVLLWTINDFPAYGNLSGCVVKGYFACPICGEDTFSHRLKHGKKNSYTGHRRFLPCNHPFRKQKKAFNGKQEFSSPPQPLSGEEILRKIDVISNSWGKNKNSQGKLNVNTINCWKKKSIFFDLEYWKYLHVRHSLDAMHIEKNVCESIIGTLLNIPGKMKDGLNSRLDLLEMGLRCELGPSKVVDVSALDKLQNDLVVTLCLLEKYFPPSFFDIMLHLTIHLVREVRLCGPVYLRWMYPFERFMKVLKGYVRNRNRPEGCIAECYIVEEAIEFCTEYLSNVDAIGIPISANIDQKVGAQIPGGQIVTIDSNLWLHAHHYVLENTTIVQPYIEIPVFKCDWVDNKNGIKVDDLAFTLVDFSKIAHKSNPFILASQAKQVFYVQDQLDPRWSVVLSTPQKDFLDMERGEDFVDNSIEHHLFIGALPQIEALDATCHGMGCNSHKIGESAVHLTSYLGVLARTMVLIRYKTWHVVPKQLKDKLWDSIEHIVEGSKGKKDDTFDEVAISVIEKIDKLLKESQENGRSVSGSNDILVEALGTPEYSGRVRAKGKHYTPRQYFNSAANCAIRDFIATSKEEQRIFQAEVLAKLSQVGAVTPQSDVSSSNMKQKQLLLPEAVDKPIRKVEDVTPPEAIEPQKKVRKFELAIDTKENIVAGGTIILECGPNYLVVVDAPYDSSAPLPIPIPGQTTTVGAANGYQVLWPTNLVIIYTPILVLVALEMKKMIAYYLDPMACQPCDDLKDIVNMAMRINPPEKQKTSKREPTWVKVVCPRQPGSVECGYYVMRYMKEIIANPNQLTSKVVQKGIGHSINNVTTALDEGHPQTIQIYHQKNFEIEHLEMHGNYRKWRSEIRYDSISLESPHSRAQRISPSLSSSDPGILNKLRDLYTWEDGTHNSGLLRYGSEASHWILKKVSGPMEGQLFTFGDGTFGALGLEDFEVMKLIGPPPAS